MNVVGTNMLAVGDPPPTHELEARDPAAEAAEKAIAENTRVTVPNSRPEPREEEGDPVLISPQKIEGYPVEFLAELEEWL